jgi:ArsR family transcriptional regulator
MTQLELSSVCYEQAAAFFKALGDPARLQIAALLLHAPRCVSEIAAAVQDSLPAVSQRLKLLRNERIVVRHRAGKQIFYSLADDHIAELVSNALAHADESELP